MPLVFYRRYNETLGRYLTRPCWIFADIESTQSPTLCFSDAIPRKREDIVGIRDLLNH